MKNLMFTFLMFYTVSISFHLLAQDAKYVKAMGDNLTALQTAEGPEEWQKIANKFEQIAATKTDEWLPNYWAGYCNLIVGFMIKDNNQKDLLADKTEKFLKKAQELNPQNDELLILEAYLAMARLSIDPMNRWQKQGAIFEGSLKKAEAINADNPRIYYLKGNNLLYTPEQFGGGKAAACPLLKKAMEKYEKFTPTSEIHPNWGKELTEETLKQCEGK